MRQFPWLTVLTLVPLLSGLAMMRWGVGRERVVRGLAWGTWALALGLVLGLAAAVDLRSGTLQAVERHVWVPSLGMEYYVGMDGLGWVMVLLTVVVSGMALGAAKGIKDRPHLFHGLVLCLMAGLFGTFTALNFVHWFLFWELSLIPAFFLVRLWGGPHRGTAAVQFFLFTLGGSVVMLLGFLALFLASGQMNFPELAQWAWEGRLWPKVMELLGRGEGSGTGVMWWVFAGVLAGLAVKVPMMPLHTWLPQTYAEASAPVSMLLTGVMSKMGLYGLVRIFLPIFQEPMMVVGPWLIGLAVWTVVASACAALVQRDLKRMLAYSSVNHLGYCLLAVFAVGAAQTEPGGEVHRAAALNGAVLQMFNHGLTAATLFWFVGLLEARNGGRRSLEDFGGVRVVAPVFCGLMGIAVFASLGLPGLNGFVGEFLIFRGVLPLIPWAAVLAVPGLLVTAVFLLRLMERVFYGPLRPEWLSWPDLSGRERMSLGIPVGLMVVLGVWPQGLLQWINPFVIRCLEGLRF